MSDKITFSAASGSNSQTHMNSNLILNNKKNIKT